MFITIFNLFSIFTYRAIWYDMAVSGEIVWRLQSERQDTTVYIDTYQESGAVTSVRIEQCLLLINI